MEGERERATVKEEEEEEEEEEFVRSDDWRGKHKSLSRGAGEQRRDKGHY